MSNLDHQSRSPWIVLASTSLAVFAVFFDTTIGFVSFAAISATFRSSGPSTLSWVLNAYTLVFAALVIPAGRLADRRGRRKMFMIGVVVFTTGSMLCGLAPNVGFLTARRCWRPSGRPSSFCLRWPSCCRSFQREKIPFTSTFRSASSASSPAVASWGTRNQPGPAPRSVRRGAAGRRIALVTDAIVQTDS